MNATYQHNSNQEYESDSGPGLKDLFTLLNFIKNAVFRHKLILIMSIILVSAMVYGVIKIMPRSYQVSSKVLIHASTTISRLARTGTDLNPREGLFGLIELLKSQENLEGIVDDAGLVEKWKKTRYGIRKKKDEIFTKLFGPPTDEDIRDMLVTKMDRALYADFSGGVLVLSVEWEDPWVALEVHKVVLNRFFEHRRSRELGEIRETIRLLTEKHKHALSELQKIIERSRILVSEKAELENQQETSKPVQTRSSVVTARARTPVGLSADEKEELERVSAELKSVQSEIERAQVDYKRRLAAEQDKLAQYQTQYGPQHPEIIKTKRYIELLSAQRPVPDSLLNKQRTLESLVMKLQSPAAARTEVETPRRRISRASAAVVDKSKKDSEVPSERELADLLFESELMNSEYRDAEDDVNRLKTQLQNALLEQDATEAAFAYRYRLIKPPSFPLHPSKPKGKQLMAAGVLLSVILGIALAVFVDVRSGIVLESWQVEKIVNIPLLGEIEEPK